MADSDMSDLNLSDDDGFTGKEKMLLEKHRSKITRKSGKIEEEVFAFDASSDEEEVEAKGSDFDDASDDGLPNLQAWGKQKKSYYNTDFVDQDFDGFNEKQEEAAKLEEEEALRIQKKLAEQLDEEDFSLAFQDEHISAEKSKEGDQVRKEVTKDLSSMSEREKLEIFHQENPEFASLVEEFRGNIEILKNTVEPLRQMISTINMDSVEGGDDLKESLDTYYHVLMNYNLNLSFYLLLKTRRASVKNHPVARRLLQYRILLRKIHKKWILPKKNNLIQQILAVSEEQIKKRSSLETISNQHKLFVQKLLESNEAYQVESSEESDNDDAMVIPEESGELDQGEVEDELDDEAKRGITYQIKKNKGLTKFKRKELRNPRVKHRMKFRKAVIRRKGQVREFRPEVQKYGGELSGIKASVTKSVKLK